MYLSGASWMFIAVEDPRLHPPDATGGQRMVPRSRGYPLGRVHNVGDQSGRVGGHGRCRARSQRRFQHGSGCTCFWATAEDLDENEHMAREGKELQPEASGSAPPYIFRLRALRQPITSIAKCCLSPFLAFETSIHSDTHFRFSPLQGCRLRCADTTMPSPTLLPSSIRFFQDSAARVPSMTGSFAMLQSSSVKSNAHQLALAF